MSVAWSLTWMRDGPFTIIYGTPYMLPSVMPRAATVPYGVTVHWHIFLVPQRDFLGPSRPV